MKKLLFTVLAALTMSFSVSAQTAQMHRADVRNFKVLPRTSDVSSPDIVKTDLVSEKTNYCLFDAKDDHANVYAFDVFDYRYKTHAFVNFTTDAVDNYKMQVDYGTIPYESIGFYSSTFVGDKIFAYCYRVFGEGATVPISMGYIDPKTGIYEKQFDMPQGTSTFLSDMTYDPETKLCYAIQKIVENNVCTATAIWTIDPTASESTLTKVATLPGEELFTIACDRGMLYSVASMREAKSSKLIKMSVNSIKNGIVDVQLIGDEKGSLRTDIFWDQSMEFDKINHKLYWFAQRNGDYALPFFCTINTETGIIENRHEMSSSVQMVALSIPYQYTAKTAPSYVRNLKGVAATEGKQEVTISWTNPTKNYDLGELTSLTKVNIIRDDKIIATVDATGIGQAQTYVDETVTSGSHIYKVQPVNADGNGVYKEFRLFVGHDLPSGPVGIKINVDKADPCHATITWTAPSAGVNGGWIDKTSLKYDVVRFPGEVKIGTDLTECKVEDKVAKTEGYYYVITSKNNDGIGGNTKSEVAVYGPNLVVPYFTSLSTKEEFNKWLVIDNNHDYTSWKFNTKGNETCYVRAEGPADDYLVSPAIMFEEGKKYQVRFKYWTINWVNPVDKSPILDKMDVFYAQEPTAAAFQKEGRILDLGEFHTSAENYLYAKQVFTAKPGEGHIAFHAYSDPDRGIIYLQNVCIREYSATDLSVTDMKGSMTVVQGAPSAFSAEIMNEGSARVENYTVDLINKETGEVLATAKGVAVDPEKKQLVTVEWTPENTGKLEVTVRVNLEGDTYPADNLWETPISTTINPAGSDTWISVNKDDSGYDELGNALSMGIAIPFNFSKAYSMVQSIYLDKELSKKKISLTGVKFLFDGYNEGTVTNDVRISAQFIDKDYFETDENVMVGAVDVDDPNWIQLYEGPVSFSGTEKSTVMEIKFTNPYYYESGNLVFMFEKLLNTDYLKFDKAPFFHYAKINEIDEKRTKRTCQFRDKFSDLVDPERIGDFPYVPFTMFSYKEGDINGIYGVSNTGLNFDLADGKLEMSETCDRIVVYSLDGKVVAEAKNASMLSLGALRGVFVIKAEAGNKLINTKVSF